MQDCLPAGEVPASGSKKTLLLGALFGGWYLFNIYFNLYVSPPTPKEPLLTQHAEPFRMHCLKRDMLNVIEGYTAAQVQQASAEGIPIPLHMHSTAGESPATCCGCAKLFTKCSSAAWPYDHVLL